MLKYYLRYSCNVSRNQGFTLIELLVVVIIVGVLSAIALPNLLANVGKAKETEAVVKIREYINAQATYRVEKGEFTSDWDELSINDSSNNYSYQLKNSGNESRIVAIPKTEDVKAVAGGIAIAPNQSFISGTCKANFAGKEFAVIGEVGFNYKQAQITCGKGLKKL